MWQDRESLGAKVSNYRSFVMVRLRDEEVDKSESSILLWKQPSVESSQGKHTLLQQGKLVASETQSDTNHVIL